MTQFAGGFLSILLVLALSGCAGNVKTVRLTTAMLNDTTGKTVSGVVFYAPQYMKLTYHFTALVDTEGKVRPDTCLPMLQKEEITIMPDFARPMAVRNASGLFSSAKLNVSLSNGLLTSVNAEPTQKLSDLVSAAAAIAVPALFPPSAQTQGILEGRTSRCAPACNSSPKLTTFKPTDFFEASMGQKSSETC